MTAPEAGSSSTIEQQQSSPQKKPTRVLMISHDVVGSRMAGPGIRYWHLARVLAKYCAVLLMAPGTDIIPGEGFETRLYEAGDGDALVSAARGADVVMPCGDGLARFPLLAQLGRPLVIDGYDPYPAETAALVSRQPLLDQASLQANFMDQMRAECLFGDFFLCATERQRYWWLGLLAAHGRLNALTYAADATLHNLIDIVPFGCSEVQPPTRQVVKGVWPGVAPDDKVVLWGGGIWEWLDPLTLLHAFKQVVDQRPDVKLVFPGTRHPNPHMPDMEMRQRAINLAQELQLLDKAVYFGEWVPYQDWHNYLNEADIGVSFHIDSVETQLAFRSRILDYISAGVPIVANGSDATAELVARYNLGKVVRSGDAPAAAEAILYLLAEPREARQAQFAQARADLAWERVARPLIRFCSAPRLAADHLNRNKPLQSRVDQHLTTQVSQLTDERDHCQDEVERLHHVIDRYERGRFIRLMRKVKQLRSKAHAT